MPYIPNLVDTLKTSVGEVSSDAVGVKVGNSMLAGGSSTAFIFGGLQLSDWGIIVGIATALIGVVVQIIFKIREDQREERLAQQVLKGERK